MTVAVWVPSWTLKFGSVSGNRLSTCQLGAAGDAVSLGHVNLSLSMHSGWIRAFVLFVGVALLANAQCYGTCGAAPCNSHQTSSDSCHHDESSPKDGAKCMHQHSDLAGPQACLVSHKGGAANLTPVLITSSIAPSLGPPESALVPPADRGSPPGEATCSRISILRI